MIFRRRTSHTAGGGAFRFDHEILRSRWVGTDVSTGEKVHLACGDFDVPVNELRTQYEYEIDGVARCHGVVPDDDPNPYFPGIRFVCAESLPDGHSLYDKPVPEARRISVIQALARTVQRSSHRGIALLGLVPELVYVGNEVVVMPRSRTFADHKSTTYKTTGDGRSFKVESVFADPKHLELPVPEGDVYQLGLLIVWIYERKHAYQQAADRDHQGWTLDAMRESRRDPFAGPKPLDELLEQILQPEPKDRIAIDEVVRLLERAH